MKGMNRMNPKKRKFIHNTLAYRRRKETQYHQQEAAKEGTLSPRGLARSVGRTIGALGADLPPSVAAHHYRDYARAAMKVPLQGKDPRRRKMARKIRKLEAGVEA